MMSSTAISILLVEDDASLQASLREFLDDHGYQTFAAGSRVEGTELVRRLRPAVCILDMNLPDGSGAEVLRVIAQENLGVRVIVMTAFPVEHLRGRYAESVLRAVLVKPVSPEALLETVARIAAGG